jgi:hypothetical protein
MINTESIPTNYFYEIFECDDKKREHTKKFHVCYPCSDKCASFIDFIIIFSLFLFLCVHTISPLVFYLSSIRKQ